MKSQNISKLAVLAAASLLTLSTAAYAANNGGRDGQGGNRGDRDRGGNATDLWRDHENGCAVGNTPPPGANCTNRERQ